MKPKTTTTFDPEQYFANPTSPRQRQYEAVRAIVHEQNQVQAVAKKFGYQESTIYALIRDFRGERVELFPTVNKGPQHRRTSVEVQKRIILLRKEGLSSPDIQSRLGKEGVKCSSRTIERILQDSGFKKLRRRTNKELGKSTKNKIIPERSAHIDYSELEPFNVDCPCVGVFFFLPYLLESGVLDIAKKCRLPESSDIEALRACLSMLALKLIGCKRLSHIGDYDKEPGLGVFAGLNVLPKPTYMNTYSCRCSETQLMKFQRQIMSSFKKKYPDMYGSDFINLDFHSIPHFGDESEMEKVWCGARGKTMKGANTIFAQDSKSKIIIYTRTDILRCEEANEVKKFVAHWKSIKGNVKETLVFDCKFTKYKILGELEEDHVNFITLRKRHKTLIEETTSIPQEKWKKMYLAIPKRKYKHISVFESEVKLKDCDKPFRQIAIKDHGRSKPTFIVTNNTDLPIKKILEVYAKRWRVENKLAELISFFNLNALSSPLMIRIHFDILWTIIADTLYHRFAQDLRRFEDYLAPQIFRKFINMPGRVVFDGEKFFIKIRKRAYTPILLDVEKLQKPIQVPWLEERPVEIIWTA
ncbi:MAG: transposase [Patescibacteria group bacterium]|nr:transposase [Patescibacteria group bacterium]